MQEILTLVLGLLTVATSGGTVAGFFYGFRQKTIIEILEKSNKAYEERNAQLEQDVIDLKKDYDTRISALEGQVSALEKIKTPPLKPLIELVTRNHAEVMAAIGAKNG